MLNLKANVLSARDTCNITHGWATNTAQESASVGMQDLLKMLKGKHISSGGAEQTPFLKLWLQSQILPLQFSSLPQGKGARAGSPVPPNCSWFGRLVPYWPCTAPHGFFSFKRTSLNKQVLCTRQAALQLCWAPLSGFYTRGRMEKMWKGFHAVPQYNS